MSCRAESHRHASPWSNRPPYPDSFCVPAENDLPQSFPRASFPTDAGEAVAKWERLLSRTATFSSRLRRGRAHNGVEADQYEHVSIGYSPSNVA
jgi:hypothetical protein